MDTICPFCGQPFGPVDLILVACDSGHQCHHCWNRIASTRSRPVRIPDFPAKSPARSIKTRNRRQARKAA
jgi:hypothetical protein